MSLPPKNVVGVDCMGLRFRRSVRIAPGVKVNLTKSGWGLTVGPRGSHYSVHSSGRRTRSVGLPGTGLYYQAVSRPGGSTAPRQRAAGQVAPSRPVDIAAVIPKPGLLASGTEKAYHGGLLAYLQNNLPLSVTLFEQALAHDQSITSAHLFAGIAADGLGDSGRAISHLEAVLGGGRTLPDGYQAKFLRDPRLVLSLKVKITAAITADPPFSELGAALALTELYQSAGRLDEAIGLLQQLHEALPDPLIRLSLCDLLFEDKDYDGVIELSTGVANGSDIDVETLHLRGAAMMALGHQTAALDVFRSALAKTAGRDPALLTAVRYDRGIAYEQLGQRGRAKAEFERVYAADPAFEDVQQRLDAIATPSDVGAT